jgi:carbonic anhydrase/acetyltransferase-like protein (isoleucine patch superfamily)
MRRAPVVRALLHAHQLRNRARLRLARWLLPGLEIDPGASANLGGARYQVAPGGRLRIAAGVVTEHRPGALTFQVGAGAEIEVGEGVWLRTEIAPIHLAAHDGARLRIGPGSILSGCQLSATQSIVLGRRAWVGPGTRVFDSDPHDLDAERPLQSAPVAIGDCAWVAADCTVLKGVTIGAHAVVGTRSLVTSDVPAHTLAYGQPAEVRGAVGDRSNAR